MRTATARFDVWEHWRTALATGTLINPDGPPQCGFYKRRARRAGQWQPVLIDLQPGDIDPETGELCGDERLICVVQGAHADPFSVWPYCAPNPITEREYCALRALPPIESLATTVIT